MNWQERMNLALACLDANLEERVDLEAAARKANCSAFHFSRMFEVITGMGPAEYVRRRRLSAAALELAAGPARVVDVAVRYGYDSPDAFSRAFKREFGCLPSQARRPGAKLHSFPPLSFSIVLKGDRAMEYRIEQGPELALAGINLRVRTKDGSNFSDIPAFWGRIMQDGRFKKLLAKANHAGLGVCGVCRSFEEKTGEFTYSIAIDRPADTSSLPDDWEEFSVPASNWAKFTSRGPINPNLQNTIKRIYAEWFPGSGWEHAGTAEIEFYPDANPESPDYWCEYWMPLKRPEKSRG